MLRYIAGCASEPKGVLGRVATIGGALGVRDWHAAEDAAAHNRRKHCQKKSGKQKKACIKKAKKHNAQHAAATTCNSLRAYCGDLAGPCCDGLVCRNPPISRCEYFCDTTEECVRRFGNPNLVCARELLECGGRKCCY